MIDEAAGTITFSSTFRGLPEKISKHRRHRMSFVALQLHYPAAAQMWVGGVFLSALTSSVALPSLGYRPASGSSFSP